MKPQLKQLSLLDTQNVSGGINANGPLGPVLDPENAGLWPWEIPIPNATPSSFITFAVHENGGSTSFNI